jgi:hypothetical protein
MSRIEKRLEKWRNPNNKQEVPKDDLESVLNHFFPEMWNSSKTGSHNYQIKHPMFKKYPDIYSYEGVLTIPTKGGQKIKHYYIKSLLQAIDLITEVENG